MRCPGFEIAPGNGSFRQWDRRPSFHARPTAWLVQQAPF
jgi:hypothetical protein